MSKVMLKIILPNGESLTEPNVSKMLNYFGLRNLNKFIICIQNFFFPGNNKKRQITVFSW